MADLQFKLTDEIWEDMVSLEGVPITAIVVWDRSMVDESMAQPVTDKTASSSISTFILRIRPN